ncbi:MAG: ABC-type transport auxiliary lipoprotein family protein [Steroidobacteraceae bacterium]
MSGPKSVLVAFGAIGCVVGCSSGFRSGTPPPQTYVLRASLERAEALPDAPSLQVTRPLPSPGFETDRIVLVRSDRRLDHFSGIRWAAELPEVVEALAVQSLRSAAAFSAVHDSGAAFSPDYLLRLTIRRFEADYTGGGGAPRVHVAFDCTLGRRSDRQVLASFAAEGVADAQANRANAVIGAFETAADAAVASMAEQILAALRENGSRLPASALRPEQER